MGVKIRYLLLVLGGFAACSDVVTGGDDPGAVLASPQPVVFLTRGNIQQTISVFREGDSGFTFLETVPVTGNRTVVDLPVGKYQFLLAGSYGENTDMNTPAKGTTIFGDMCFTVLPDDTDADCIRGGDELFLQDEKADSIYDIQGSTTIRATLKRAVARAIVYIRRGWLSDDGQYISLPYQNDSIIRYFSKVRLDIGNA